MMIIECSAERAAPNDAAAAIAQERRTAQSALAGASFRAHRCVVMSVGEWSAMARPCTRRLVMLWSIPSSPGADGYAGTVQFSAYCGGIDVERDAHCGQ